MQPLSTQESWKKPVSWDLTKYKNGYWRISVWSCIVLIACFNVIMADRVLILSFNFMTMYCIYVISSSFALKPLPSPLLLKSVASFSLIIIAAHRESFINRYVMHFKHSSLNTNLSLLLFYYTQLWIFSNLCQVVKCVVLITVGFSYKLSFYRIWSVFLSQFGL